MKFLTLGAGNWGTVFSNILIEASHDVILWTNVEEDANNIRNTGYNKRYLPEVKLNKSLIVETDLNKAFSHNPEVLVVAVPSHAVRSVAHSIKNLVKGNEIIVSLSKGFEEETLKRLSEVILEEIPLKNQFAAISGPNIANEIAKKLPAGASISGYNEELLNKLQKEISSKYFKLYVNMDLIGMEVGGATKNIIAIAAGFIDGKGLGTNARAQVLTRGLAEMIRLGKVLGANETTFAGLSGLGDLITTSFSPDSRNYQLGYKIGKGMKVSEALGSTYMVIEGVKTTKVVFELSKIHDLDMPITTEIYNALYLHKDPSAVVTTLLSRPLKAE